VEGAAYLLAGLVIVTAFAVAALTSPLLAVAMLAALGIGAAVAGA
jgi:hypothetical protein